MFRALAALAVIASCNATSDTRPETADYVIEAILVPQCGRGGCHTADTQPHGLAFDTIDGAKAALATTQREGKMVKPFDPDGSYLVQVMVRPDRIMPPDQPVANADIDLIARWIAGGADGL